MRRFTVHMGAGLVVVAAMLGMLGACGSASVSGDCNGQCQDTETTCIKACNDDTCKTKCTTDYDNCSASCSVHVTTDGGS